MLRIWIHFYPDPGPDPDQEPKVTKLEKIPIET